MIKYVIAVMALVLSQPSFGQGYGEKIDPNHGFSTKLKELSTKAHTISCDFSQKKYLSILANPVSSKGRFYYMQGQNMCLEYTTPPGNAIVMSCGKFKMVNAGKVTILDNKANPMMRQLSSMLTACMTGNVTMFAAEATTAYYESESLYTVVITPTSKRVKTYIKQIVLSFDKHDMTLSTLQMSETDTDYTLYEFFNKKLNGTIPGDKFKI